MQKQSPRGLKDQVARGLCHVKMGDQREAFPDVNPARLCAGSLIEEARHCERKQASYPSIPSIASRGDLKPKSTSSSPSP